MKNTTTEPRRNEARIRDLRPKTPRAEAVKAGAFNSFAKFGDIKGDCDLHSESKGWIEVESYQLG